MEENKEQPKETNWKDSLNKQIEKQIETISKQQVQQGNVDYLYKLIDIHKDLKNEEYWEKEEENMYRDYGEYGARGVPGTGRYGYGDAYGRRGVPGSGRGRYRGEEPLEEMKYHYGNYMDSGNNYGAKDDSAYKMTEAFKDFGFAISKELEPKDKMMFKQAMQEIMQELDV